MKKVVVLLVTFLLPSFILRYLLRTMGFKIGKQVRIGFSLLLVKNIEIGDFGYIGHFNFIKINDLTLQGNNSIKHFNILKGPFSLLMKTKSRIINQNYLNRAKNGISYGNSEFIIGFNANITSNHYIDLTQSVVLGDNTVLGGRDSQIWTHGYVHDHISEKRVRVDGKVNIGNNVYLGSKCMINPGTSISDNISVGSGCTISKDLVNKGMYVSQPLRLIEQDYNDLIKRLKKVEDNSLIEDVYFKP